MFIFLSYIMNISIRRCYILYLKHVCFTSVSLSKLDSLTNIGSVFVWERNSYHFNCPKIKWLWSQFAFCMVATNKPKKDTLHCLLEKKEKIGFEISRNWIVLHCIYFNPDKENKKHPERLHIPERIKFICQWVHLLYLFASCHFLHVSV